MARSILAAGKSQDEALQFPSVQASSGCFGCLACGNAWKKGDVLHCRNGLQHGWMAEQHADPLKMHQSLEVKLLFSNIAWASAGGSTFAMVEPDYRGWEVSRDDL